MKNIIFVILISILYTACDYEEDVVTYKKWENGIIYYQYDNETSYWNDADKTIIEKCMRTWETATDNIISFKPVIDTTKDYVYIKKSEYNRATVGAKIKSNLELHSIYDNPMATETLLHELGHVIGLIHEHQRIDRNDYINVYYENIDKTLSDDEISNNFTINKNYNLINFINIDYDYNSVMHYNSNIFANVTNLEIKPVLTKKDNSLINLYPRIITTNDILKVYYIYSL